MNARAQAQPSGSRSSTKDILYGWLLFAIGLGNLVIYLWLGGRGLNLFLGVVVTAMGAAKIEQALS